MPYQEDEETFYDAVDTHEPEQFTCSICTVSPMTGRICKVCETERLFYPKTWKQYPDHKAKHQESIPFNTE